MTKTLREHQRNADRLNTGGWINYKGVDHELKRALATKGSAGTNEPALTAVSSKKLRVVGLLVSTAGTWAFVTKTASPTAISAVHQGGSFAVPFQRLPISEHGYFEGQSGENIGVTTGAAYQMDIYYIETEL